MYLSVYVCLMVSWGVFGLFIIECDTFDVFSFEIVIYWNMHKF